MPSFVYKTFITCRNLVKWMILQLQVYMVVERTLCWYRSRFVSQLRSSHSPLRLHWSWWYSTCCVVYTWLLRSQHKFRTFVLLLIVRWMLKNISHPCCGSWDVSRCALCRCCNARVSLSFHLRLNMMHVFCVRFEVTDQLFGNDFW